MHHKDQRIQINGGRFDFDDGGTYCGGWEDGKAHGHGVCTGPKGQGEYSGSWHYGFEVSGVYTWPSSSTYEGHWQNGKRHGLGVETRGRWVYRGEWTQGFRGRYGVRQSATSGAKYEGTWANGLQDGYGSETYADNGTFQGQWLRGMRHGYGVRTSAPFGLASFYRNKTARASLTSLRSDNAAPDPASERDRKMDDSRGGFVLKAKSDEPPARRRSLVEKSTNLKKTILQGFRIKKQRSTGDIDKRGTGSIRSTGSSTSWASNESGQSVHTDSNVSFVSQDEAIDANVTETYMGEWKNDKRCGFGISERSDGLKYEGEWYNNKKYGYGLTTFRDGAREEGKYKNNVLITSNKKKHIFLIRSAKFRERIDSAVNAAIRASQIALQKADIAISRTATARGKAEQADVAALHAREDSDFARLCAKQFAPEFHQPGIDLLRKTSSLSQDMKLQATPKPRREDYRSRSMYIRKDGSEVDLNSSNYDEHSLSSPGGLRMSIDYGNNPRSMLVDHLPPGEEEEQHSAPMSRMTNYLNPACGVGADGGGGAGIGGGGGDNTTAFSLRGSIRRGKNLSMRGGGGDASGDPRQHSLQQAMNDHHDHYKVDTPLRSGTPSQSGSSTTVASAKAFAAAVKSRPPGRSATPRAHHHNPGGEGGGGGGGGGTDWTPDSGVSDSMDTDESPTRPNRRSTLPNLYAMQKLLLQASSPNNGNYNESSDATSDEGQLRKRTSGVSSNNNNPSDIPTAVNNSPLRTASLYVAPRKAPPPQLPPPAAAPTTTTAAAAGGGPPKRKKSLPDIQQLPRQMSTMSREEVSVLSSARREEVRRQVEEAERYRANPLLYVFNPHFKDWLSKQQLVMLVLFLNISLAIMFFNLLT